MKPKVSLVITDLDNTLFDWVDMWGASFGAMLAKLVELSGVSQAQLEREFKAIHQQYGTSEYAFSIEELPSLRAKHPEGDLRRIYQEAIDAYRDARAAHLQLYPTIFDTLRRLERAGCKLVAYTESKQYYTHYRLRKLGLDMLLDFVYSPPDHPLPADRTPGSLRRGEAEHYGLRKTQPRHTPEGELKPNPGILREIVETVGGTCAEAVYVGDSLMKDILMAQTAEVTDVWAKYGLAQHRDVYELLRRVTHWTDADVAREKALEKASSDEKVEPAYTLEREFAELLELFEFIPFRPAMTAV